MILELIHPEVSRRSCEDCCLHEYNHSTGERIERGFPRQPIKRPKRGPGSKPPCLSGVECFKGVVGETRELNDKNRLAYEHYLRCKATGHFPDDPIVARNAAIIGEVESAIHEGRERATAKSMAMMTRILGGSGGR